MGQNACVQPAGADEPAGAYYVAAGRRGADAEPDAHCDAEPDADGHAHPDAEPDADRHAHCDRHAAADNHNSAPDNDPRWLTHLSVPQQTKVVDPQALVALFRQFLSEQEKHQRTPALEFIVLLILQQLTRDARLDEQADGAGTTLAWKAQKLIRTQYHRPLSTALLARELYCNADYLGRVYRRVFHLTLTEAIHRQRVREAEKLLISEARSLTEVAALCGFNDVGYFRQIFRKHTGLTPAAWKRRYSKEHINS